MLPGTPFQLVESILRRAGVERRYFVLSNFISFHLLTFSPFAPNQRPLPPTGRETRLSDLMRSTLSKHIPLQLQTLSPSLLEFFLSRSLSFLHLLLLPLTVSSILSLLLEQGGLAFRSHSRSVYLRVHLFIYHLVKNASGWHTTSSGTRLNCRWCEMELVREEYRKRMKKIE